MRDGRYCIERLVEFNFVCSIEFLYTSMILFIYIRSCSIRADSSVIWRSGLGGAHLELLEVWRTLVFEGSFGTGLRGSIRRRIQVVAFLVDMVNVSYSSFLRRLFSSERYYGGQLQLCCQESVLLLDVTAHGVH